MSENIFMIGEKYINGMARKKKVNIKILNWKLVASYYIYELNDQNESEVDHDDLLK